MVILSLFIRKKYSLKNEPLLGNLNLFLLYTHEHFSHRWRHSVNWSFGCGSFNIIGELHLTRNFHHAKGALRRYVDAQNEVVVNLWKEVVNVNSGTMNFEGVRKVGKIFQAKLEALGFVTRWVDGSPFNRAGHLIAEHKGKEKGKTVLLIGHLDTVFELSSPFQQFIPVNDSTVKGPGVGDMKGGDVIMIAALQALKKEGVLQDMNLIVVLSGDEELSGEPLSLARHDLMEAAKSADIAIGFEDGDGKFETANISRRSSSDWELKVSGGSPLHHRYSRKKLVLVRSLKQVV